MHEHKVFETIAMSEFLQKIHEEKTSKTYYISLVQDQKVIFFIQKMDSIFVNLGIIYSFLLIFYIVYHLLNHGIFTLLTNNLKSFLTIQMIENLQYLTSTEKHYYMLVFLSKCNLWSIR